MIGMKVRPRPCLGVRVFGWTGTWLCSAAVFPLLAWLTLSVRPLRPVPLPAWGSPAFWGLLGLDVLMASLMTLRVWTSRNRPVVRRSALWAGPQGMTRQGRGRFLAQKLVPMIVVALFPLLPILASPGGVIHWSTLLGGMAALAVLSWLGGWFSALVLPPRVEMPTQAWSPPPPASWPSPPALPSPSPASWPPPPMAQVAAPPNPYRAWASETDVVYSRPRSTQMLMGVLALIPLWLLGGCVLILLLILSQPGVHNGVLASIFGAGCIMGAVWLLAMLSGMGPRELHVRRQERTYRQRSGAEWGPAFLSDTPGPTRLTWPWRIVERFGTADEFAGVGMIVRAIRARNSTIVSYVVMLRWTDPARPPTSLGGSSDEARARAWQAQAADDLGVSVL